MTAEPQDEVLQSENVLAVIAGAEIDIQIATARKYPRSLRRFLDEVTQMSTLNEDVASDCFYALPRKDKSGAKRTIEGPSARFAEIVVSAWGNARAGARVVSEDKDFITAQGAFHDLERNVAITFEVRRRITDRNGRRFSPDMIAVTGNAAASIALRNAVFKGVPKAYWSPAFEAARKTAIGDSKTLSTRRLDMLAHFMKLGAEKERIFSVLGVKGIEDVTLDHLAALKGVATAIRDGDTTIEQAFPEEVERVELHSEPEKGKELDTRKAEPVTTHTTVRPGAGFEDLPDTKVEQVEDFAPPEKRKAKHFARARVQPASAKLGDTWFAKDGDLAVLCDHGARKVADMVELHVADLLAQVEPTTEFTTEWNAKVQTEPEPEAVQEMKVYAVEAIDKFTPPPQGEEGDLLFRHDRETWLVCNADGMWGPTSEDDAAVGRAHLIAALKKWFGGESVDFDLDDDRRAMARDAAIDTTVHALHDLDTARLAVLRSLIVGN